MIRLMPGVRIFGIRPELTAILMVVDGVFADAGYPCIVTSGMEGSHSWGSLHYSGCALDLRSQHIKTVEEKQKIEQQCREHCGPDCDVILEDVGLPNEHFHVEYQPKRAY